MRRLKWLLTCVLVALVLLVPLEASAGICVGPGMLVATPDGTAELQSPPPASSTSAPSTTAPSGSDFGHHAGSARSADHHQPR